MNTKLSYIDRNGVERHHSFGFRCSLAYARSWFRVYVEECQGALSVDERRNSQLKLLEIVNTVE